MGEVILWLLVGFGIYFGIVFIIGAIAGFFARDDSSENKPYTPPDFRSSETNGPPKRTSSSPSKVTLRASKKTERVNGVLLNIILFEIGNLNLTESSKSYGIELNLYDVTDSGGNRQPILCAIEDLRAKGSVEFEYKDELIELGPHEILRVPEYRSLLQVPLELLVFPGKGLRKIECVLKVHKYAAGGNIHFHETVPVGFAKTYIEVDNKNNGYLDEPEERIRYQQIAISLGMHIAGSDGNLSPDEAALIKEWAKEQIDSGPEHSREESKKRINLTIRNAFSKATNGSIDVEGLTKELKKMESMAWKYQVIELCLDIMKSDGVADPRELKELEKLSEKIGLDEKRYKALLDRRLAKVKSIKTDSKSNTLGITSDMDKDEIRKILNSEFKKWNARVSHTNPTIQKNAEKMINMIADARKKYL